MRSLPVSAASLALSLLLAEALVRVFDPIGISYYTEISRHMAWMEEDPELLWRLPAGAHGVFERHEVHTDRLGVRVVGDGERWQAPSDQTILWIGDSVVFGWGVPAESTFVHRLQTLLSDDSTRVRCVNAAVSGYDSRQELGALEERVRQIDPDRVALVYVGNDMELSRPLERHVLFLRQSRLYQLVRHTVRFARGDPGQRRAVDRTSEGWCTSLESVRAMADFCGASGIPFTVFLYGMDDSAVRRALWEDLSGLARDGAFELIDILPWFSGMEIRSLTNSVADGHANTRAHAILASHMAAALTERARSEPMRLAEPVSRGASTTSS